MFATFLFRKQNQLPQTGKWKNIWLSKKRANFENLFLNNSNPIRQIVDNYFKNVSVYSSKESIDTYKLSGGQNADRIWSFCIPNGKYFDNFFPIGKVKWGIPWFSKRERSPTVYGFRQYMFMDLLMHKTNTIEGQGTFWTDLDPSLLLMTSTCLEKVLILLSVSHFLFKIICKKNKTYSVKTNFLKRLFRLST